MQQWVEFGEGECGWGNSFAVMWWEREQISLPSGVFVICDISLLLIGSFALSLLVEWLLVGMISCL